MYRRHLSKHIPLLELVQHDETDMDKGLARHLFNNFLQSDGLSALHVFTASLQRFTFNVTA